jgi:FkbM family methyltransferase
MRSIISALAVLGFASGTNIPPAELTAALGADDECRANTGCALELAQLRAAKVHRDAPQETEAAPQESEAEAPQQDAEAAPAAEQAKEAPAATADFGHPAWLSECKRVFVDLGCNNGVNIRKLYEPKKFDSASILSVFDEEMGSAGWRRAPGKQNGLCALGLEPNPDHFDRLKQLEEAYGKHGWNVHFYPFAAYNTEGKMSFNKTTQRPSEVDKNTAAGAHLSMKQEVGEGSLEVRTVNAAEFLNSMPEGSVKLVVMDIEGAEYETLAQMMQENVLCANVVNRLLVETHGWGDVTHWGGSESFAGDVHPRSFQAVVQRMDQLKGVDWCKPGELSKVEEFDDASYAEDVDDNFGQWR